MLGNVDAEEGDFARAQQLFDESLRRFRDLGDQHYILLATRLLAWTSYDLGDHARARALHEEVVRKARATDNERMQATSLGALAEYALYERRIDAALPMLKESTRIYRDLGERLEIGVNLARFARAFAVGGSAETAARLLSSSEALHAEIGASARPFVAEMNAGTLSTIRTKLDEATFAEAWEQGRALTLDGAVALALDEAAEGASIE